MLQEIDKDIIHAWSAVVCRGMLGSPREVAAYLGNGIAVAEIILRMGELRAMGQLPRETLLPPVALS